MTEQRRLTYEERKELKRRIHEARKLSPMEFRIAEQTERALERHADPEVPFYTDEVRNEARRLRAAKKGKKKS